MTDRHSPRKPSASSRLVDSAGDRERPHQRGSTASLDHRPGLGRVSRTTHRLAAPSSPAVGAVDVPGSAVRTPFQIAELVEHEKRMVARAAEVTVVGRVLLVAMGRADAAVHVEDDGPRRLAVVHPVDPDPRRSVNTTRFSFVASHSVSKRPIWLVEAAERSRPLRSTIARIAGSRDSRSASLTSSYPAKRPNTDWRNRPVNRCRVFLPRRRSDNAAPAISVSPRASSSSR